jgi:hypothetical protein
VTLLAALAAALADLAKCRETIGYGALARRLAIPGPGSIQRLTEALEVLMEEDAQAGSPFRAVLCEGKLRSGLPAPGFFEAAQRLGRFSGPLDGPEAEAFVAGERAALFAAQDP